MKILVINTGSSTIKYRLFDMQSSIQMAVGILDRIGDANSRLIHESWPKHSERKQRIVGRQHAADYHAGMQQVAAALTDREQGVITDVDEIDAVGHRVGHGGERFKAPTLIDNDVIEGIRANVPLAPLHNVPSLAGIESMCSLFPAAPQVAVFDTAFHQTMPARAFRYAVPAELYERHQLRRYGFHGTSHAWVAHEAAALLERPLESLNLISLHLGSGASATAIEGGRSIDTSMGLTPLEGLIMGTRCGDIDPAIPAFLAEHEGLSISQIDSLLMKQSGLTGICGSADMRDVELRAAAGDKVAELAIEMYVYRVRKYIGSYWAVLGHVDALVFTAGVGENSAEVRQRVCNGLNTFGLRLDPGLNGSAGDSARAIHAGDSRAAILVVPTNEEMAIARQTRATVDAARSI